MKKILIVIGLALCLAGAAFWLFTTGNTNDSERVHMELVIEGNDVQKTVNVLQKRLESYGVKDLRTESLEQNVLTISFPPQDSMACVRKLMCTKGKLEIRPTFTGSELYSSFIKADEVISEKTGETVTLLENIIYKSNPYGCSLNVNVNDTARVAEYLRMPEVQEILGKDFIPAWSLYPEDVTGDTFALIGIRRQSEIEKVLDSDEVEEAFIEYFNGMPQINIKMTKKGGRIFGRLTEDNVGRQLAITIDGCVYTYPYVNERIEGGKCSIVGMEMTESELKTTAAMLNGGMLPATVMITREWIDRQL